MKRLNHPNIIKMFEVIDDKNFDGLYIGIFLFHA